MVSTFLFFTYFDTISDMLPWTDVQQQGIYLLDVTLLAINLPHADFLIM